VHEGDDAALETLTGIGQGNNVVGKDVAPSGEILQGSGSLRCTVKASDLLGG
jgi:hypothetical protein